MRFQFEQLERSLPEIEELFRALWICALHGHAVLAPSAMPVSYTHLAMLGGLPYQVLRDAIFTHPTAAEGLVFLLASVPSKAMQHA